MNVGNVLYIDRHLTTTENAVISKELKVNVIENQVYLNSSVASVAKKRFFIKLFIIFIV